MQKMDSAHFQELARQDRKKLAVGVAVAGVFNLILLIVGANVGSMTVVMALLVPILIAAFVGAEFFVLRQTRKMEKDSFEEGMHLVMEGVPMVCTMMENGNVVYCNDSAPKLVGLQSKEEYFRQLFTIMHEFQSNGMRTTDLIAKNIKLAFERGMITLDFEQGTASGGKIPCEVTLVRASVYGLNKLLVFTKDMTATHELRKQEEVIKEKMRAVLDSAPLLCIVSDEDGNIMDVNKEAENMFGIPDRQMFINNYNHFVPTFQPDGSNTMRKKSERAMEAVRTGHCRYPFMYRHNDGTPLPTEEIVTRITVDGKNLVIAYSRDMRAEHATKAAEQAAQKRLQSMTDRLNGQLESQSSAISESSAATEKMVANTQSVSNTLSKNAQNVKNLQEAAAVGQFGLNEVATDFRAIAQESESLLEINSVMQNIASQTNLLSMNAAIEAAHAGASGLGFAVVADEIRKLAESSSQQSKTIGGVLKKIKGSIDKITKSTDNVMNKFEAIDNGIKIVAEQEHAILNAMAEQSAGSTQIMQAIAQVNDITGQVKEDARQMVEAAAKLGV